MRTMSTIGFTLFISIFFAAGFGILGYGLYSLRASRLAKDWPTAEGKVVSCEIKTSSDSEGTTYRAVVKYSYAVAGRTYQGDRIAFGYAGDSRHSTHQDIVERLSSAKTVLVRYDPAEAARSVLSYGLNRSTIYFLIFGVTWLLFVTGFTVLWCVSLRSDAGILTTLVTTR